MLRSNSRNKEGAKCCEMLAPVMYQPGLSTIYTQAAQLHTDKWRLLRKTLPGFISLELHFRLQLLLSCTSLFSLALLLQKEGCPLLSKLILCFLFILQSP